VLEHIDNDFKALQEIQRILRPGGLAHIEVPADPPSFDLYDEVLMHFRRHRLGDLTTKAREAGFAIVKATIWAFSFTRYSRWSRDGIKRRERISPSTKKRPSWHGKSGRRLAINSCRWRSKSSEFSVAILRHPSGAQTSEDLMR
jgi:SAM-dependent methyltransferase